MLPAAKVHCDPPPPVADALSFTGRWEECKAGETRAGRSNPRVIGLVRRSPLASLLRMAGAPGK
jgi:hypothetical protein